MTTGKFYISGAYFRSSIFSLSFNKDGFRPFFLVKSDRSYFYQQYKLLNVTLVNLLRLLQ